MKAYLILPVEDSHYEVSESDERFDNEDILHTTIIHTHVSSDIIKALFQLLTSLIEQEKRTVAFGRED